MFLVPLLLVPQESSLINARGSTITLINARGSTITLKPGQLITAQQLQKLQQTSILSGLIVSVPETLTSHTAGESNVIGNAVKIKDTGMSDSNKNHSYIQNVINIHVHFGVKCCSEYIFQ